MQFEDVRRIYLAVNFVEVGNLFTICSYYIINEGSVPQR
jgi:hypothetical protein